MKSKIEAKFPGQDFPTCRTEKVYIMDYTNQTGNVRGIELNDSAPMDIEAFCINNSQPALDITFCAFKENTIKLAGETKEKRHCEGVLFPTENYLKTWIAFLELKYPKRKNLGSELKEARDQLLDTLELFRGQGIIEEKRLVYLIFSAPKYVNQTPYESWSMQPSELKNIRKTKHAIIRGVNSMDVISSESIKL